MLSSSHNNCKRDFVLCLIQCKCVLLKTARAPLQASTARCTTSAPAPPCWSMWRAYWSAATSRRCRRCTRCAAGAHGNGEVGRAPVPPGRLCSVLPCMHNALAASAKPSGTNDTQPNRLPRLQTPTHPHPPVCSTWGAPSVPRRASWASSRWPALWSRRAAHAMHAAATGQCAGISIL